MAVAVAAGPRGTRVDVPESIELILPLPGLAAHTRYSLTPLDEIGVLFALRSDAEPEVRLFVITPRAFFTDYAPSVPQSVRDSLDLDDEEPVLLTVVNPPQGDYPATANLLAPLVLNARTGRATQAVLDGSEWPLRAPLA
jgi:flagellar assembly factor FliW